MTTDGLILPCRDCGKAIAVVKVGGLLTYGHLVNPTFMHHEAMPPRVRLARAAAVSPIPVGDVPQRQPEASDTLRGHSANAGASHPLTTRRHAGQSKGSTRTAKALGALSSGITVQSPRERASQPTGTPSRGTPRAPVAARRPSIAGEA